MSVGKVTRKSRCESGVNGSHRGQSVQESSKILNLVSYGAFQR